jgi:hypothetical protein
MADFTILKRELRKQIDATKTAQEIMGYMIVKKNPSGYNVFTTVDGEEYFVCTL